MWMDVACRDTCTAGKWEFAGHVSPSYIRTWVKVEQEAKKM
jgi:hypothetical protein